MFDCYWLIIPLGGTTPPINPVNVSNTILQTATQSSLNVMQLNSITPPPNYGQNGGYTGNCVNNYTGPKEEQIYWFHPDHLGSSSYITGADGEVTQNIEYFPNGEVFVENHNKQVITVRISLMARNLMLKQGTTIMELDIIILGFHCG